MKIRSSFVSNSSSASFVLDKNKLTGEQIVRILHHEKECDSLFDAWCIDLDNPAYIILYTSMDNFDMYYFLVEELKIDKDAIIMEDGKNYKEATY